MADPFGGLPPDLATQAQALQRRQALAQALMQRSLGGVQMPQQGRLASPVSPLAGLAPLAEAYFGAKTAKGADKDQAVIGGLYKNRENLAIQDYLKNRKANPEGAAMEAFTGDFPKLGELGKLDLSALAKQGEPYSLGEGDTRFEGGKPVTHGKDRYRASEEIPENWNSLLPAGVKRDPSGLPGAILMPNNAGKEDRYVATFKDGKLTGYKIDNTPQINVTATANAPGVKGDTKYAEERMGARAKSMAELDKSAEGAYKSNLAMDRFLFASKKGMAGGAQPLLSTVQNFLTTFGFSPGELKSIRQMEQALGAVQTNMIAEFGARGLTDNDMKVLRLALPKVETDRESREAVANIVKKMNDFTIAEWENQREAERKTYPELAKKVPDPWWYKNYKSEKMREPAGTWEVIK